MDDAVRKAAIEAVVAKRDALLRDRADIRAAQIQLDAQAREVERALLDCVAAGRLFGVDVELPDGIGYPRSVRAGTQQIPLRFAGGGEALAKLEQHPITKAIRESEADGGSIRDMVLQYLRSTGTSGIKAAEARAHVEGLLGRKLHPKTVGMTLYRLAEKGLARRDGHTWFAVPETANPGGDAPGSINP